jgi:hypothetical protein
MSEWLQSFHSHFLLENDFVYVYLFLPLFEVTLQKFRFLNLVNYAIIMEKPCGPKCALEDTSLAVILMHSLMFGLV